MVVVLLLFIALNITCVFSQDTDFVSSFNLHGIDVVSLLIGRKKASDKTKYEINL